MTRKPKAGRRDANHRELVKHWLSLPGTSWFNTADLPGQLDGVGGINGIDFRIEIKDGSKIPSKQKLTKAEYDTFAEWRGREPDIWRNTDDVEYTWNLIRSEAK
jgi:hypothetical protein